MKTTKKQESSMDILITAWLIIRYEQKRRDCKSG